MASERLGRLVPPATRSTRADVASEGRKGGAAAAIRADLLEEGVRLLQRAGDAGITMRLIGGVAIRLRCPTAAEPPLTRTYKDLDFVGRAAESERIQTLFGQEGYSPDQRFNALHGARRLLFWDEDRARQVDVMLDVFEMCHRLDLRPRLDVDLHTLPLADLLLTKLQIVEANEKDLADALALLVDHALVEGENEGVDVAHVAALCARDWGLWRTLHLNRERLDGFAERLPGARRRVARTRLRDLFERIDGEPKTLAWKLRARVGERVRWYELPEEVR